MSIAKWTPVLPARITVPRHSAYSYTLTSCQSLCRRIFYRRRQRTLQMEEASQEHSEHPTQPCVYFIRWHWNIQLQHRSSAVSETSPESDGNKPLFLVNLTGSRLLAMTLVIVYGTTKLIPAFRRSALTWLDVLLGVSTGSAYVLYYSVVYILIVWKHLQSTLLGLARNCSPTTGSMVFPRRSYPRPFLFSNKSLRCW